MEKQGFFIKTPIGYVSGVNHSYGCVQSTDRPDYAKPFFTKGAAERFIDKYDGAGMGLSKATCEIVKIQ